MNSLVVLFAVICGALAAPHLEKRSIGHAVAYSVPAAVSHQSRVDVHSSPALVSAPVYAEPIVETRAVVPAATVYAAPAAVSHQSRVDVRSSPAVVAAAPLLAQPVFAARSVYAPATAYVGGSAITHQSRVDVETSPALVAEQVVGPALVEAHSVFAPTVYASYW